MRMLHPHPPARPDLQRRVHGARATRRSARASASTSRRPTASAPRSRGGRQHDRRRRSPHGRGRRSPRRLGGAAPGHPARRDRDGGRWVKTRHPVFETPITLTPSNTVGDALGLIHKRAHGAVIVIDADRGPIGVFTEHDAAGFDRFTQLQNVMSTELDTLPPTSPPRRRSTPARRTPLPRPGRRRRRAARSASSRASGPCDRRSTGRRSTPGPPARLGGGGHQRRPRRPRGRAGADGHRRARHRHGARAPDEDAPGRRAVRAACPDVGRSSPATWSPPRARVSSSRRVPTSSRWASARVRCARPG
jgi:hypothetical protein